jgi:hypothetical protein
MKRLMKLLMAFVVVAAISGMASAQRGHGKGQPATTGVERAESVANPHGQRGIENAEAKQAEHKDKPKAKHKKHPAFPLRNVSGKTARTIGGRFCLAVGARERISESGAHSEGESPSAASISKTPLGTAWHIYAEPTMPPVDLSPLAP